MMRADGKIEPIDVLESWYRQIDPFSLGPTTGKACQAWMMHPEELHATVRKWLDDATRWQQFAVNRLSGGQEEDAFPAHPEDERFSAPDWSTHPGWDVLKEWYLFNTRWLQDALYATPGLEDKERSLSAFWLRQWLNAVSPTNFLPLNPDALRKAQETRGASIGLGIRNFLDDLQHGEIAMTDRTAFRVGENLATTPGAVVYRGRLLEVLHYQATTETVHEVPVVLVSPWINKYYILDLDARKSLVRYLVDQGYSVFVTSWKNPDENDRNLGFDDYLTEGIDRIVDVARDISGADKVHLTGYCIGGTLTAVYLAWLARRKQAARIATATLFTTLTDFARPGDIEVFLDDKGLEFVESKMEKDGYLDGKDMAASFRMLRSNSLIWNYWISNYLMGETPKAFDLLYWNMDTTRMPARMHSFYLREFYQKNKLFRKDGLLIAEEPIDLARIKTPLFMVSAEEDHIAPWKQTWQLVHKVQGPVTFTLSSAGHIIGIINPPSPTSRRSYWQGAPQAGETADAWQARQTKQTGSWWDSWVQWLAPHSGEQVPFALDSKRYPKLGDAPGTYVFG